MSEPKDADRGPHEEWCDTQNNISERCNCMASSYIDKIEDLEAQLAEASEALRAIRWSWENDAGRQCAIEKGHACKTLT